MFTGGSKEPVVAAMLPATITLISGLTAYFFEKKTGQRDDLDVSLLPALVCALVIFASFGAYYASNLRSLSLRKERIIQVQVESDKIDHAEIEVKLNRAKLCRQMFSDDIEMRAACVDLLKTAK
ncbi:hypothetical protein ASG19_17815 [Rhizobium sp. Leaf306]|nr:hypothetical protein ASG19_17815 [Rhizobium sp. Leaf306]